MCRFSPEAAGGRLVPTFSEIRGDIFWLELWFFFFVFFRYVRTFFPSVWGSSCFWICVSLLFCLPTSQAVGYHLSLASVLSYVYLKRTDLDNLSPCPSRWHSFSSSDHLITRLFYLETFFTPYTGFHRLFILYISILLFSK